MDTLDWTQECEVLFQGVKIVLGILLAMQAPKWHEVFSIRPFVDGDATEAMPL